MFPSFLLPHRSGDSLSAIASIDRDCIRHLPPSVCVGAAVTCGLLAHQQDCHGGRGVAKGVSWMGRPGALFAVVTSNGRDSADNCADHSTTA